MQHGAPPAVSRQLRTLLIEPDSEAQEMLELALSIRGHAVSAFDNVTAARNHLSAGVFSIAIATSTISDDERAALVRALTVEAHIPAVLVALVDGEGATSGTETSTTWADAVLPWPSEMDQLRQRLDAIEEMAQDRSSPPPVTPASPDGPFLVLSPNGAIRSAGSAAESLFGFPLAAIPGANGFSFFHPDDAAVLLSIMTEALVTPGPTRAVEVRVRREGDTWRTIAVTAINRLAEPGVEGIALSLKGPDATIDQADQVTRGSLHDPVTGLPNAALFHDRIDHAIARGARHDHPVIVMMLDFNGFQDDLGSEQDVDDGLLIALSQRIRSCLRMSDTAARLGYDQFGVILEEVVDPANVRVVADRLVKTFDIPFYDEGREKQLTPNIGIAVSTIDRFRAEDLIRDANIARSWARVQGSGRYVVFDPSMAAPDDEPITSQFNISDVMAAVARHETSSVDDRLVKLQERVNALERDIERIDRGGLFAR